MPRSSGRKCHNALAKQGIRILETQLSGGYGKSKRDMRKNQKTASPVLHNDLTARMYETDWQYYCKFLSEQKITTRSMETASDLKNIRSYGQYLEERGLSASTIHTYIAAVCRVTGNSLNDLHDPASGWTLPVRSSADYVRSRHDTKSDIHCNPENGNNILAVTIARCTGLRNDKELQALRGNDLIEKDGHLYINVRRGKGGKPRTSVVIGSDDEIKLIRHACASAGNEKVCPHVNTHLDIHSYRAEYAARIYASVAMTEQHLQRIAEKNPLDRRIYITRVARPGVPAGTVFDRKALQQASLQLGHSLTGREAMIVSSYAYKIIEITERKEENTTI